ncbi:MAG: cytochrome P450 [Acidimicrobiia bacterium]
MVARLHDPDWYRSPDVHARLAGLRATTPVQWVDEPDGPGYWAVLRHADIVHASRHPEVFSSSLGGMILEDSDPEMLEQSRRMLVVMDPPKHSAYRHPLAPHFAARVIATMERQVRALCRTLIDDALDRGDVEFVHEVAGPLPSLAIAAIMGIPAEDTPRIRRWAELSLGGQDDDVLDGYEGNASIEMIGYAMQFAAQRRGAPRTDDITSLLLDTTFEGGAPMDDVEFGSFFFQLVAAANDTTRTLIASGVDELLDRPDDLAALRADPTGIPTAVEEMLRYRNPVHYTRRTATTDTELAGQAIAAGDKVVLSYTSANRDDDVFVDAQSFDTRRSPNPHLGFGVATHFCLGAHLARLEVRVFLEELLANCATIERTGAPVWVRSNLTNGYRALPLRLAR